jgi:hypothetical protein
MQIIAKGFQTYGGDYQVDQPELAIEIRLKRPGEQYSIYKAHNNDPLQVPARATAPAAAGQPDQK